MPSKVLFVLSSHDQMLSGKPTGWYLPEAAHPYYQVTKAGYEVVFASPKGGKAPLDPSSVEAFKEDAEAQEFLKDSSIMKQIESTVKLDEVDASEYVAYFAVGGHGPVFDLTDNATNQKLILDFYNSKKVTSSVCHGPTVFLNIKESNGERFVKGKKVTCFSDEEEEMAGLTKEIPFLVEKELRAAGADFQLSRQPWGEEVVTDEKDGKILITGGNPASASALGAAVVKAIKARE
ncbi:type 1 glutamine amidotransferase domain-containing protein [Sporobolomyces salmoneus]|uniref:type 1 glutamine amidotransferase domain-containing protein n=1 Tax=Sporobolomyces salmoneus TaxID=183962 RepID=UPI00317D6D71